MFEKFDPAARPRLILDRLHHDIVRACCLCNLIKTKSLAVQTLGIYGSAPTGAGTSKTTRWPLASCAKAVGFADILREGAAALISPMKRLSPGA
jgi:hypothetical protein